jgi:predicted thioesterase
VPIEPGLRATLAHHVTEQDTAAALGSGDLAVLATPRLLAWCEEVTVAALAAHLGPDQSSVGTRVQLEHLHATPVGGSLQVTAQLVHVDGRLLRFEVTGEDDTGTLVGHGQVTRVVVDRARFLGRLQRH